MLGVVAQVRQFAHWPMHRLTLANQVEEMVQLRIHAIRAQTLLIPLLLVGCVSAQSYGRQKTDSSIINVSQLEITGLQATIPEGQKVDLRGEIDQTEYGSFALFPQGKVIGDDDAGKCIDLVYPRSMKGEVSRRAGNLTLIHGHFVYLDTLPVYTMSLDIEGVSHKPVCQVFSKIERYPYFIVESLG
jgi:hypothetical protein